MLRADGTPIGKTNQPIRVAMKSHIRKLAFSVSDRNNRDRVKTNTVTLRAAETQTVEMKF